MSVTIRRVTNALTGRTSWWRVVCDEHGCCDGFNKLRDAKQWATSTYSLSGKWRRRSDGSYEEVHDG